MSNEGQDTYVIAHITDAQLQLLREKPLREISIQALCALAGGGRASFYRNFTSKEGAYMRAYIAYTLYGWIQVWFQRGMQETAEEIAAMFQNRGL